ncbi:MAG: hypothetical protein LAO56_06955 [Acidobacteriia bacterium]|nr:hypothetical protein [Terriglobia bacterium]
MRLSRMSSSLKVFVVLASIVLILAGGSRLGKMFYSHTGDTPKASASSGAGSDADLPAGVNPATFRKFLNEYGLDRKSAVYLAQVKTSVVSQDNISVHLRFTFPDNLTADETITITPDAQYTPSAVELSGSGGTSLPIYGRKFAAKAIGPDKAQILLQYVVPLNSVPPGLQQTIRGRASAAQWFTLVPSAWAQSGGGGAGVSSSFEMAQTLYDALSDIGNAFSKSEEHSNWMQQLDAMENCAKNPTNPLTQKAYQEDPGYGDKVLSNIQDARSEVQQMTAVRYLNQEASVATNLVDAPIGQLTGQVSDWNENVLKDLSNQQVQDIGKSVNCEDGPPPDPKQQHDGTIKYHFHRENYLDFDEDDRIVTGEFDLQSFQQGIVGLKGAAEFKTRIRSSRFVTQGTCKGHDGLSGGGTNSSFQIQGGGMDGDCRGTDHGRPTHDWYQAGIGGFSCTFHNVDVVNGGSYTAQADGEDAPYGQCELELTPQRK